MSDKPAFIISDEPEERATEFGFGADAKTIADLIAFKENRTPLVIGIYGAWGSGKTTLMKTIANQLGTYKPNDTYRVCKPVWFQAWKYAGEEAILAALIEEVFKTMEADGFLSKAKAEFEKLAGGLDKKKVVGEFVKFLTAGTLDVTEFFADLPHKEKLGFYGTFEEFLNRVVGTYLDASGSLQGRALDDRDGVLVIFIDDLDRCPGEKVVKVLETIKLFLDKKGCVFVIGAAQEVIESALRERHKGEGEARNFMDKIVQVTFILPKIAESEIGGFVEKVAPENQALQQYTPLIAKTLNHNLRKVKRFVNNLNLSTSLAVNRGLDAPPDALLRWSILEYVYPDFANLVKQNPAYVNVLAEKVSELENKRPRDAEWHVTEELVKEIGVPAPLVEFVKDRNVAELVQGFPRDRELIESLISLSAVAAVAEEVAEKAPAAKRGGFDEMAKVPRGPFLFGDEKQSLPMDYDYLIDVYPVTNEQFRRFIEAGGYERDDHWSDEGRKWKEKEKVKQPRYWEEPEWNKPDHPVVGVSWFEAEAYCNWSGKRLPTEEEWEKAARGTDGREYPWGDGFDEEKCNSGKSGIGGATPVIKYVNGISPYGCYDMAGNVWQWTASWYDKGKKERMLRGGSWLTHPGFLRSAYRHWVDPSNRYGDIGYRCLQDIPK